MPMQSPRWLPWLSPLAAILGAWFIGIQALNGGFWSVLFIAVVCAMLPAIGYRLVVRFYERTDTKLGHGG